MPRRTTTRPPPEAPPRVRVTTGLVLHPRVLAVLQAAAAQRAAKGAVARNEAGVERPYSVSALVRELLDGHVPTLEAELEAAGIKIGK